MWGIKDPVTLEYFELGEEENFVLQLLDEPATLSGVCQAFRERFRPRTLSEEELRGFLGQLLSQNLILSEAPGHGPRLVEKGQAFQSRSRRMKWTSLLAIRFRGFDPDRLLSGMLLKLGWLFSPWAVGVGLLLMLSAITLVAVQFEELIARLPAAQAWLTVPNLLWLSLLLAIVKVLHELGHGLTCKRFGGECHELGVMLLVLTPTLYCNVSDIWMLKNKWQRIAVSVAGMWVEAVIASACTLLWWFSEPGLFHSLCLNLMFLCGVSTLLLNGNPLLRYDGYYVLADWLEIPNLQQQSTSAVRGQFSRWFCGFDAGVSADLHWQRRWGLVTYGVTSSVYRLMITGLMLWGLHHWLEPLGLEVVAQLLAVPTLGFVLLAPLMSVASFLKSPSNREQIHWPRFWLRTGFTLAGLVFLLSYPLPSRVTANVFVDEDEAQRVYVTMSGTLVDSVHAGDHVVAGQELARLKDPQLTLQLAQLQGELNLQRLRLENLERQRVSDPLVAQSIPTLREAVRDLEQQLVQRQLDEERLHLRSQQSGIVLPEPWPIEGTPVGTLTSWTGSPLDQRNRGCFLRAGTTLCRVGPPQSRSAVLLINQDDINLVHTGQLVRIVWNEMSGEFFQGEIVELSGLNLTALAQDTRIGRVLPVRNTSQGVRPIGTWYQARLRLQETAAPVLRGSSGIAKIEVKSQSLIQRFSRWFTQTFAL